MRVYIVTLDWQERIQIEAENEDEARERAIEESTYDDGELQLVETEVVRIDGIPF